MRARLTPLLTPVLAAAWLATAPPAPAAGATAKLAPPASAAPASAPWPTRFANLADLARLPWFAPDARHGVRLADPDVGPIVDFHTHLAQTIGPQHQPDLRRATPQVAYYLDRDAPFDLVPYANRNFSPTRLAALEHDLTIGALRVGGGASMRATHTAPNLAAEMAAQGVAYSVLLPVELPLVSDNAGRWREAVRDFPQLLVFGGVHPHDPLVWAKLDAQFAHGAKGVKVHPAVQLIAPEDATAMRLYRHCGVRGGIVFFHCGPVKIETPIGRRLSQVRRYEAPIAANPRTRFVLGHAGALQASQAIRLARTYPNVWLELASQGLPAIRRILREAPRDRIVFGSDWPFYPQAVPLAKVLLATAHDRALRHAVLYDNAAALLGLPPRAGATPP